MGHRERGHPDALRFLRAAPSRAAQTATRAKNHEPSCKSGKAVMTRLFPTCRRSCASVGEMDQQSVCRESEVRSFLLALGGDVEKLLEKMTGHRAAIFPIGADVVDRREIALECGNGARHGRRRELLVEQRF